MLARKSPRYSEHLLYAWGSVAYRTTMGTAKVAPKARQRKQMNHDATFLSNRGAKPIGRGLRQWDEIPSWQQDNEYILSGYRVPTGSFTRCLQSLAYVHNETINIYSHLFGAAFFFMTPIFLRYTSCCILTSNTW